MFARAAAPELAPFGTGPDSSGINEGKTGKEGGCNRDQHDAAEGADERHHRAPAFRQPRRERTAAASQFQLIARWNETRATAKSEEFL